MRTTFDNMHSHLTYHRNVHRKKRFVISSLTKRLVAHETKTQSFERKKETASDKRLPKTIFICGLDSFENLPVKPYYLLKHMPLKLAI